MIKLNIYKTLNEITLYIDEHIEDKIDYNHLAKMMGVNNYTMQRIFSILVGTPLAEYIRKRKLSCAAFDLINNKTKIIDIAFKYNYENSTSFSRAFEAFHGIKPSEVTNDTKLKEFPRITFTENQVIKTDIEYSVVTLPKLKLYGIGIKTDNEHISYDAPNFFISTEKKYINQYGPIKYGMTIYNDAEREECSHYYVLYDKEIPEFELIEIPESKWLKFIINSQKALDIQKTTNNFYSEFLPSCKYCLKDIPELEYYHDGITEFYVPID